ncbi:MAG: polysaccharide deacetylase family protein [Phycisphaerae bacterium]
MPLHRAVEAFLAGGTVGRPLAAITFDDGYQDNFRYAAPILMETGIRATFFVIADLVGTKRIPWYDRIARSVLAIKQQEKIHDLLTEYGMRTAIGDSQQNSSGRTSAQWIITQTKKLTPDQRREFVRRLCEVAGHDESLQPDNLIMDWHQLAELADFGHEIGSHSAKHEMLPQLDESSLEAEVSGSRHTLEAGLNQPVRSFCYPNGDVDGRVARAVEAAGYTCAVTVDRGGNEPQCDVYRLKRWFIHEDRLAGFRSKASGTLLRMELCGLADCVFGRHRAELQ